MAERSLEATCGECGRPLSFHPWEERPARCDVCFDTYLRDIDHDFLESYGQLGVTSRRTVAETCLRALVLEMPPARKILAMAITEQFLLASSDLIGLYRALKERDREPIMRSFLSFQLDADASADFFSELIDSSEDEMLAALGLPAPEELTRRYPGLDAVDTREVGLSLRALVRDLRLTAERSASALLLSELADQVRAGPALTQHASWLPQNGLRADQVATLVLDERRRMLVVQAVPVDEDRLAEVVDAIDCMTRVSSNLIYAYLTLQDEEARLRALSEGRR
ncbi:MAG: hypothetical protein WEE64_01330 [Dehalococcoidia bacterium]